MDHVTTVIQYFLSLGASVVLPIIIFLLSLFFRMKLSKAIRAALTIGIGFIGINLVIGLLTESLGPAAEAMVRNTGLDLPIIDAGWPVAAAISFGTAKIVPWIFILAIAINLVMIALKWTTTLNVDMWNFWHFIFSAAFVYMVTKNFWLGLTAGVITLIVVLKLADIVAPIIQDYYKIPGVTTAHTDTVSWAPVGWTINKILDHVPGFKNNKMTPEHIQEKYGSWAEPMVMGTLLGLVIGVLAYYPQFTEAWGTAIKDILMVSISMGAVMLLLPRMVGLLMEGLIPLSDAAQEWIKARYPDRELNIGLDAAILVGYPANMSVAIILVPITLALGILMSYLHLNQMLPFTDLANTPFFAVWATTWCRGNIARGTVIGSFFIACMLTIGTFMAPTTTELARQANFAIPNGASQISAIDSGAHLIAYFIAFFFVFGQAKAYSTAFIVFSIFLLAFAVLCYVAFFVYIAKGNTPGITDRETYMSEEELAAEKEAAEAGW